MIAGLPVHWVACTRHGQMPTSLLGHDKVYVRTYEGAEPQYPMEARHVNWENVAAYAVAHADSDQTQHRTAVLADDFYPGNGAE